MSSCSHTSPRHGLLLGSLLVAIVSPVNLRGNEWTVVVSAGPTDRAQTPVAVRAPFDDANQRFASLVDVETGSAIAAQITESPTPEIIWILQRPLTANTERAYRLIVENDHAKLTRKSVECAMKDGHLLVKAKGRPVMQYNVALNPGPDGTDPSQARNAYIHPLYSPNGQVITDDFAPDHVHQRGLFFAWTKTKQGDRELNFWEVQRKLGRIVHTGLQDIRDGDVFAQFKAKHEFVDVSDPAMPTTVLRELWTVRVYNVAEGFLFDLNSEQTCVAEKPLVIGPYHYGGMAIRGRREWINPTDGNAFSMLTSEGLNREAGNHSRPQWVHFGGRLNGKESGLISFCHPDNFRFPQPVRLHASKPYFCFAPLVGESFQINPGQVYKSQYRFFTYTGGKDRQLATRLWSDYANPPQAVITP